MRLSPSLLTGFFVASSLGLSLGACKKDEVPKTEVTEALEQKLEEKVEEAAEKVAEVEDAATALLGGTGDKLSIRSVKSIPEHFVAVGGIANLSQLFNDFGGLAAASQGEAFPEGMLSMFLLGSKSQLGVDLTLLDFDKPIAFGVPDPKAHPNGVLAVLALKEGRSFDENAINGFEKDADGVFGKAKIQGIDFWFNQTDQHFILATDPAFLKNDGDFIKALSTWTPDGAIVLDTQADRLRKSFEEDLIGLQAAASGMLVTGDPVNDAQVKEGIDSLFDAINTTDRMGLRLGLTDKAVLTEFSFDGKKGGPLSELAEKLAKNKSQVAGYIPSDVWFSTHFPMPELKKKDIDAIQDAFKDPQLKFLAPLFDEATMEEMQALYNKHVGEAGAFWLGLEGSYPFALGAVTDMKDGKTYYTAYMAFLEKLFVTGYALFKAENEEAKDLPDFKSSEEALTFIKTIAPQAGLDLSWGHEDKDKLSSFLKLKIDYAKLPPSEEIELIKNMLGNELEIAVGASEHLSVQAISPKGIEAANALLAQKPQATKGSPAGLSLRVIPLLKAISPFIPELKQQEALIQNTPDEALTVTLDGAGNVALAKIEFPKSLFLFLAKLGVID